MKPFETIAVEVAAERLGVSSEVIDRWIAAGHIFIIRDSNYKPLVLAVPFERLCQRLAGCKTVAEMEQIWWSLP